MALLKKAQVQMRCAASDLNLAQSGACLKISKTGGEGQISGVLHSASLYMGDEKLLKVKVGDFLIKIFNHDDEITKIGERVFLEFEDGSMLALE